MLGIFKYVVYHCEIRSEKHKVYHKNYIRVGLY